MKQVRKHLVISCFFTAFLTGCADAEKHAAKSSSGQPLAPVAWTDAAGVFIDRNGAEIGAAILTNAPRTGVLMRLDLRGLPHGWHGVHLHRKGDCSDFEAGFKASGGHINPDGNKHGLLNEDGPERADLPNIFAHTDGRAIVEIFNSRVALYPSEAAAAEAGPHPLMDEDGFAIVVHRNADNHVDQPIGRAGERIACAAIGGE